MLMYVYLHVKNINNRFTVNKLNVSKTDLRFDRVMLLIIKR